MACMRLSVVSCVLQRSFTQHSVLTCSCAQTSFDLCTACRGLSSTASARPNFPSARNSLSHVCKTTVKSEPQTARGKAAGFPNSHFVQRNIPLSALGQSFHTRAPGVQRHKGFLDHCISPAVYPSLPHESARRSVARIGHASETRGIREDVTELRGWACLTSSRV